MFRIYLIINLFWCKTQLHMDRSGWAKAMILQALCERSTVLLFRQTDSLLQALFRTKAWVNSINQAKINCIVDVRIEQNYINSNMGNRLARIFLYQREFTKNKLKKGKKVDKLLVQQKSTLTSESLWCCKKTMQWFYSKKSKVIIQGRSMLKVPLETFKI